MTEKTPKTVILIAQIRAKRNSIRQLIRKETDLDKKIQKGLVRAIENEKKHLKKAQKTKDKTRVELIKKLKELKHQHQEYTRKTQLIKKMRVRQQALENKIQKIKSFISKHKTEKAAKLKIIKKQAVHKAAKMKKVIKKAMAAKPKKTVLKTAAPAAEIMPQADQETPEIQLQPETPQEPMPNGDNESGQSEEIPSEKMPEEITEDKMETAKETQAGYKMFEEDGVSFEYPDWEQSPQKSAGAVFSVEQGTVRFELFKYEANPGMELEQNTKAVLNSMQGVEIISEESINHYVFVTYLLTDPLSEHVSKHYSLFAQTSNGLYKIEANGEPDKLDEQSALIVKVFKSFAIEE